MRYDRLPCTEGTGCLRSHLYFSSWLLEKLPVLQESGAEETAHPAGTVCWESHMCCKTLVLEEVSVPQELATGEALHVQKWDNGEDAGAPGAC